MTGLIEMPQEFEIRGRETRNTVGQVISRWERPSPFRCWAEGQRALADAYEARARFWRDVIEYAIHHPDFPSGLLFDAFLDAEQGCVEQAKRARREARDYARCDQERAFASYVDNITAARAGAVVAHSGMAA
jgi:hypothetical protein